MKTVEEWLDHFNDITENGKKEYRLMEEFDWFDDKKSVEIYTSNIMDISIIGKNTLEEWNKEYSDENGLKWSFHLYAYWNDGNIMYVGVLYDDVEKGSNYDVDLNMEESIRKALDIKVTEYMNKRGIFKMDSSLENYFNDNLENIVRKIRETYPDVYKAIKED